MGATTRCSPWRQRALELLADGEWREFDSVRREIGKAAPPGMALRRVEKMRENSTRNRKVTQGRYSEDGERFVQRSKEYLIECGRKRLALEALKTKSFEIKDEEGRRWVRLSPSHAGTATGQPSTSEPGCAPAATSESTRTATSSTTAPQPDAQSTASLRAASGL